MLHKNGILCIIGFIILLDACYCNNVMYFCNMTMLLFYQEVFCKYTKIPIHTYFSVCTNSVVERKHMTASITSTM